MSGITETSLTIGTYGIGLRQTYPIVPLAETVTLSSKIEALLVNPYSPSFLIQFEYIGIIFSPSDFDVEFFGLSPPADKLQTSPNSYSLQPSGNSSPI